MHKWSNGSTKTREDVKVKQRAETPNMTFHGQVGWILTSTLLKTILFSSFTFKCSIMCK
jgi:hypothetical protein